MVEAATGRPRKKEIGGSGVAPPDVCSIGAGSPLAGYSPEVPTQPVSETSTVTPSGPVYFTSTFP